MSHDYEPAHYYVAVAGTIVAGPLPEDAAEEERIRSERHVEPGETVELVPATRADLDRARITYQPTVFTDRRDLDKAIARHGGLIAAVEAGITADQMPPGDGALRAAWKRLEATLKPFCAVEDEVNQLLNQV
jgi:hypothetical protein